MDRLNKVKINSISSKILAGNFGKGKYFGYSKKKVISLVEIKSNRNKVGFGESLVGIYSPDLYEKNLKYLSKFFLNKNLKDALGICNQLQRNKFFYYSGLLKSILASIEIGILNLYSMHLDKTLAETINILYFSNKLRNSNLVKIYSSAGSIKSNITDLKRDLYKTKKLGINLIKIRIDTGKKYQNKIKLIKKENLNFAVDLISNTYEKNRNFSNMKKFLIFINKFKPRWIEEALNVNDLYNFKSIKRTGSLNFSYGENFNSFFDFWNLAFYYKFKFINVDISHLTITELVKLIKLFKKKKLKTKIIFHCWGGIVNLHTSLEFASLLGTNIEMVEFPITDFSLNNEYVNKIKIIKSKADLNSINRKNQNLFYRSMLKKKESNKSRKYEFKF